MPNLRFTKYNNKSTSVCLTARENPSWFSLLIIYLECSNTLLSLSLSPSLSLPSLVFFSSSLCFPCNSPWLSSQRWQHFSLSSLTFFSSSFPFPPCSPWLSLSMWHLFLWHFATSNKASQILVDLNSNLGVSLKQKSIFFLLVSRSIFPLPWDNFPTHPILINLILCTYGPCIHSKMMQSLVYKFMSIHS